MGAFFGRFLTSLMLAAIISAGCLARLRGENGGSGSGKKKQAGFCFTVFCFLWKQNQGKSRSGQ